MKSESAFNKLIHSNESDALSIREVKIIKVYFHRCSIIYLHDAQLILKTSNTQQVIVPPHSICYVKRKSTCDILLHGKSKANYYNIYEINNQLLCNVYDVMNAMLITPNKEKALSRDVFWFSADENDKRIFNLLVDGKILHYRKLCKIIYLLSKCDNIESLVHSLSREKKITFSEKLTKIVESDLSKAWSIKDFSKVLCISESSIRQKLKDENIKYTRLILEIRMNHAVKLITTTEKHINVISRDVGYVSTSYFIKKFKGYFGITPKQFSKRQKVIRN
ncbi:AraC family transcriptional regulator [Escherichia coli]|uniref:AraC family transcriptional regulator n=1 Tax=Escherichia coli TaxID=562 RepID=UPI00191A68A1|nr:AraC family transcriptional regulator [Escherichia coli]CAD5736006.1 transcriptional activator [Escherichia coli]CAD5792630.1 transcriptional activator [Escherichia coli]